MTTKASAGASRIILSASEVKSALSKYWKRLADLPARALARFKKIAITLPPARLRSTAIQAFMIDELRTAYGDDVIDVGGRSLLRVNEQLVVQCRKIDGHGRTKNIPTERARHFNEQLLLPGFPPGMRVTLGYRLTRDQTTVAEVSLVARQGNDIIWREDLHHSTAMLPLVSGTAARRLAPRLHAKPDALEERGVRGVKKDPKTPRS